MAQVAFVPIHVDALFLAHDQLVAEARADFSKLPYVRNGQDIHPTTPFLSRDILSIPFHNDNLHLKAGIHLHWALPDAMTKTMDGQGSEDFPAVPDIWQVSRFRGEAKEKSWIVESSYLFSPGEGRFSGSVTYPVTPQHLNDPPFRFLGRKIPWAAWKGTQNSGEYISKLTAVGYGEPTFSAFYPNCHSVFGCHDPEIHEDNLQGLSYQIVGWYKNPEQDFLTQIGESLQAKHPQGTDQFHLLDVISGAIHWDLDIRVDKSNFFMSSPTAHEIWEAWKRKGWIEEINSQQGRIMSPSAWKEIPDANEKAELQHMLGPSLVLQTCCFSQINISDDRFSPLESPRLLPQAANVMNLTIANTGTEALSAFLADESKKGESNSNSTYTREQLEDQLEAILLAPKLEGRQLDIGPKFREARHEKGFKAVKGGIRWVIRGVKDPHASKHAENVAASEHSRLPDPMAHALNQLNLLQKRYDAEREKITTLRQHLFADWNKYLQSEYPPESSHEEYPDPDEIRYFIEQKGLPELERQLDRTGSLTWEEDQEKRISIAMALEGAPNCLAQHLSNAINNLIDQLKAFNRNQGLLLALKLGEKNKDQTTPDSSGCQLPATLIGGVEFIEDTKFHQVAQFNGTNAQLLLPSLTQVKAISCWLKLTHSPAAGYLIDTEAGVSFASGGGQNNWKGLWINGQKQESLQWNALPTQEWVHVYLELDQAINGQIWLMGRASGTEFLAGHLAHLHVLNHSLDEAGIQRDMRHQVPQQFVLQTTASARYYQAKEPVLLISGKNLEASQRHGFDGREREDGKLHCISMPELTIDQLIQSDFKDLPQFFNILQSQLPPNHFAFNLWKHQPWHPFLLEWQVITAPLMNKSNMDGGGQEYRRNYITANYVMGENAVDLDVKKGKFSIVNVANEYSNTSVLTPYASIELKDKLGKYLERQLREAYAQFNEAGAPENQDLGGLINWYTSTTPSDSNPDPLRPLIPIYQGLSEGKFHISQALGGFNDALLMNDLVFQLPVDDPLGFERYQAFAHRVKAALGNEIRSAPNPVNDFSPIRSGVMRINQARLVDTFGRSKPLNVEDLVHSEHMKVPGRSDMVHLRPRLVQAARLNFRWLSALDGDQEMNEHPATSPICGWVLANHLDHSLAIYASDGKAVCSVRASADAGLILQHPPGPNFSQPFVPTEVNNLFLRRMIIYLRDRQQIDSQFLKRFIEVIDSTLENIDPENHTQHADVTMYMSRPLALVRASLDLEIQGNSAINHSWNVFRHDLMRNTRDSEGFTNVEFPIRLGEYKQLNDGLIGYWLEDGESYKDNQFFAPQSAEVEDEFIITRSESDFTLCQALSDQAQFFSMLLDPRGSVHATSGILPTKAIDIPPDQYAEALRNIQISFLTSPILTKEQGIHLPFSQQAGFDWTWLDNEAGKWTEQLPSQVSTKADLHGKNLIREGWLTLSPTKTDK